MASSEGDLHIVQRIGAAEYARRIDQHPTAQDERRKRREQRKPSQSSASETETPQDIVDVHSGGAEDSDAASPSAGASPTPPAPKTLTAEPNAAHTTQPQERHLDIKV